MVRLVLIFFVCGSFSFMKSLSLQFNRNLTHSIKPDPYKADDPTTQATLTLRKDLFIPVDNILYYAILVAELNFMESSTGGSWDGNFWPSIPDGDDAEIKNGTVFMYQTTPVKWAPFEDLKDSETVSFTIGTGESFGLGYYNKPLREKMKYSVKVRAFTGNEFKDSEIVHFQTREHLPIFLISSVLGGVFTAGLIAVVFSITKREYFNVLRFFNKNSASSHATLLKKHSLKGFATHVEDLLKTVTRLNNEYHLLGTLSADLSTLCLHGQRIDNRAKNRFVNILPFDVTRVELSVFNNDPSTDYINANFIKGYRKEVEYIAAQGPKKETCHDFLRMITEQNVKAVVMLTEIEENGVELCYRYFPDFGEVLKFKDVQVECVKEDDLGFCIRRELRIRANSQESEVVQLHFNKWSDFKCPERSSDVIRLCEYSRQIALPGCKVVHSSAGVGRTGVFIALSILLQQIRNGEKISVFNTVLKLRQQRVNMVQNLEQYKFLYSCVRDAVTEYLKTGKVVQL